MSSTTSTHADEQAEPSRSRLRAVGAVALTVVFAILLITTVVAVWLRTTVFTTDAFVNVLESILSSEEVETRLGDFIADEAIAALDLEPRLESRLSEIDTFLGEQLADLLDLDPAVQSRLAAADLPNLASLAAPISAGVDDRIRNASQEFVRSDLVQDALPQLIAVAHGSAVRLLRNDLTDADNITIDDGDVILDVTALIGAALVRFSDDGVLDSVGDSLDLPFASGSESAADLAPQLEAALGDQLPPDFGRITVMSSTRLANWVQTIETIESLLWLLVVLTPLAAVAAIWVSPRPRRTVVQMAFASLLGLAILVAVLDVGEAAIAAATGEELIVKAVIDAVLASLRTSIIALALAAAVVGGAAFVLGKPWLHRPTDDPDSEFWLIEAMRRSPDAFYVGGFAAAALALLGFGISILTVLVIALLLGAYLAVLAAISNSSAAGADEPRTA